MKRIKSVILTALLVLTTLFSAYSQDYTASAKKYFAGVTNSSQMADLIAKSTPTLEECRLILSEDWVWKYYGNIQDNMANEIKKMKALNESYSSFEVKTFTCEQMGDACGKVFNKLVTLYGAEFKQNSGGKTQYNFWVNVNGRWVYFPR
jgi:hypothetical protein